LKIADVVVHDRLISEDLLHLARPDATLINVGKSPDGDSTSQDDINAILIEHGKTGKTVIRLKGGDPFVFGRGGEELLALKDADIPVEVVPGISSALAAPAYAGIPATQRDVSTSFTVVTGHEHPSKPASSVNFAGLARVETVIFLMGVRQLPGIVSSLMQHGRDVNTPVACVEWGTFPQQRTISGKLGTIVNIAQQENLRSPAVIVVGAVAGLSESMAWHKTSPLADRRIALEDAALQFPDLAAHLIARGAFVTDLAHVLDAVIIASPEEAHIRADLLVCCDADAADILRAGDVPFVEIQAEATRDFVAKLEVIVR
jgi:uroporphyrinogen III methyltransferase/synthase